MPPSRESGFGDMWIVACPADTGRTGHSVRQNIHGAMIADTEWQVNERKTAGSFLHVEDTHIEPVAGTADQIQLRPDDGGMPILDVEKPRKHPGDVRRKVARE